ncbi:hypothetical protein ACQ4PT_001013 [Festuca glaucescens]
MVDAKRKKPICCIPEFEKKRGGEVVGAWVKLTPGWAKLNFDVGLFEEQKRGSWGAVLRDESGYTLLSAWGCIDNFSSAEMAESITGPLSVWAILPVYAYKIQVENDGAALIAELNGEGVSKQVIVGTVAEIKNLLHLFLAFIVSKVNRFSNRVSHELPRLERREVHELVLLGASPPDVLDLTKDDCNRNRVS